MKRFGYPDCCTSRPDFYGPFWVATTSVLFLAAGQPRDVQIMNFKRVPKQDRFSKPEILGNFP